MSYYSRPVTLEDAHRAIRYLEWWLPISEKICGTVTVDSINILMDFILDNHPAESNNITTI